MTTQQRTASLPGQLKLALRWLMLPAALLYVAVLNWHRGPQGMLAWVIGLLALVVAFALLARTWFKRRLLLLLREPTPEPTIDWLRRTLGRANLPHTEHSLASSTATVRALYGQYARALDELDELSWSTLPSTYQALALHTRALVHYLSRDNPSAGVELVQQAEALLRADKATLGASKGLVLNAMYADIGRALAGEQLRAGAAAECSQLAAKVDAPSTRVVALWAAALAHQASGQSAQANETVAQLRMLAPHCTPLHDLSLAQPLTPSAARLPLKAADSELGCCAAHPDQPAVARCVRCGDYSCRACTHPLSEQSWICASCHTMLGDLRRRFAGHEARLRATGAIGQVAAVFWAAMAIPQLILVDRPWPYKIVGAITPLLMGWVFWNLGRALRSMQAGIRPRLFGLAAMMLFVPPFGTALGGYYLWLLFGPVYTQLMQPDYARALLARPDLDPRSPWPLALGILGLLFANFVVLLVAINLMLQ